MNTTDRDRAIEMLLRSRRADESDAACIDAESLAAWIDGGLSAEAHARVEQHAAGCGRCQALLASMARTVPEREARPWWRSAMAKWVVPVAAVATALVVWVAVERNAFRSSTPEIHGETGVAVSPPLPPAVELPNAGPPPAVFADKAAPAAAARRDESTRKETNRADNGAASDGTQRSEPRAVVGGVAGGQIDAVQLRGQAGAGRVAGGQATTAAPVQPAPAPPAAPLPPPPARVASLPAEAPLASTQMKTAQGVAETVTVTGATASNLAAARASGLVGSLEGAPREIASPDPNYRWRIVPPGSIQRSTDGGGTWAVVDPVPGTVSAGTGATILTAGAAPARDLCWIVGRSGVVLLTTDGATWRRRPIPEPLDLTGVRATDATHAVVTTATGRQFATTDGGMTWIATK